MVKLLLILAMAAPLGAETGTTAMPFLKMDAGARAAALGGAYTALGDDAGAVFYNPASAALVTRKEVMLGHNEWLEGLRNENAAYVHPVDYAGAAFAGFNALFSGSMDKYDEYGAAQGSFSSLEGALTLGYAAPLGGGFYGGAALKSLYQKADSYGAMAWAGDAGLLKVMDDWRFGASVSNFGTGMKLGEESFGLPLTMRAGAAWDWRGRVSLSADAVKAGENSPAAAAGAELHIVSSPGEAFFLRGGYRTGRTSYAGPGWSAGFGLQNGDIRIDYAFTPYGELGSAHRLNISLRFGAEKQTRRARRSASQPAKKQPVKEKTGKVQKQQKKTGGENPVYFMW